MDGQRIASLRNRELYWIMSKALFTGGGVLTGKNGTCAGISHRRREIGIISLEFEKR